MQLPIGTKVRVTNGDYPFFIKDDVAVVVKHVHQFNDLHVLDFNNQGNTVVYRDGFASILI